MFFGALGGGLFPLISGYLFDITGNYYASLIFLGVGVVGGLASMLLVKPPKKIETV
jgi:cyanate permease